MVEELGSGDGEGAAGAALHLASGGIPPVAAAVAAGAAAPHSAAEATADDDADWDLIRTAYEAGTEPVSALAQRFGVTRAAIQWRVRRDVWASRYSTQAVSRGQIIARLFRLLERQTIEMDKQMQNVGDKEVAALGRLVATLDRLMDIDQRSRVNRPKQQPSVDMAALRQKLADRIDRVIGDTRR